MKHLGQKIKVVDVPSLWEKLCVIPLDMLFVDLSIFILYAVDTSVEMCFGFTDPVERVGFQQKRQKKIA